MSTCLAKIAGHNLLFVERDWLKLRRGNLFWSDHLLKFVLNQATRKKKMPHGILLRLICNTVFHHKLKYKVDVYATDENFLLCEI